MANATVFPGFPEQRVSWDLASRLFSLVADDRGEMEDQQGREA